MGQKLAAYNAQGAITAFYDSVDSPAPQGASAIEITDAQWQVCLASPGGYVVINGALAAPTAAQLLSLAQSAQLAALSAACKSAILAGFTSGALGAENTYPSDDADQRNMASAAIAAQGQPATWTTSLWCASGSPLAWSMKPHTSAQAIQVHVDWVTFRQAQQQKYAGLVEQVNAATTAGAVQAITW